MVQPGSFYWWDIVNKVNMLRPEFYFMMDRDLWLRMLRHGEGIHIGKPVAKFQIHTSSKSSEPSFKKIMNQVIHPGLLNDVRIASILFLFILRPKWILEKD